MSAVPQRRRDLGRILDDAFAGYRLHWRTLVGVALAIAAPVQLVVVGLGAGWLTAGYDGGSQVGARVATSVTQLLVVAPLVSAASINVLLLADRRAAGPRPPVGRTALVAALESFRRLFGAVLLAALLTAAGILLIVPALVVGVLSALVPQAVVLAGERGAGAVRRSWTLVRGNWWWTFAALLTAEVIVAVGSAAVTVPASYAAEALDVQAVELAATIVAEALMLPFLALVTTLVYFALAEPAAAAPGDEPPPSAPPDPGAEAWERRRREGWQPPA